MEKLDRAFRRPRHSVTEWNLLSKCSRQYEWTVLRPRRIELEPNPLALLGTRVHAALRFGVEAGARELDVLENEFGKDRFCAGPLKDWIVKSEWMQGAHAPDRTWTELTFEVPVLGEIVVGAMDRVVERQGQWTLIDFKIVQRQKDDQQDRQDWIEGYRLQMQLYLWALGELEPKSRGKAQAILVEISPSGVRTHRLDVAAASPNEIEELVGLARRVIAEGGKPQPSKNCRNCSVRNDCPEGSTQVQFF